jgi:hypothetical protein
MEFQKIQITKQGTLNVTYKNGDGDIISFAGANVIHKDLKQAMQALVPHIAIITEQREAYNTTLSTLKAQSIADDGDNVYKRMSVDTLSFSDSERKVSLGGCRILGKGGVITVTAPTISLEDSDSYEHNNDLDIDIEAVKYEAKEYIEQRKWGVKQAEIDFNDIDPYKVEAGDVPEADAAPKKRGRKPKKAA